MTMRMILFCAAGGLGYVLTANGHPGWGFAAGLTVGAALLPVMRRGPKGFLPLWATTAALLLVVGLYCTMSEGLLFYPEMRKQAGMILAGGTAVFLLASAWLAGAGKLLKLNDAEGDAPARRGAAGTAAMTLLAAVSYLVYYEVFGAIVFLAYTKQFYPHAVEQVGAMGAWFPVYQLARGLAMTLAVLPVIRGLRMSRGRAAVTVGLLLWVVGGLAPLLIPNATMVPAQRLAHVVEIFTQNFSLGVTAVLLLRPGSKRTAAVTGAMRTA